jgi:two-component system sensor histidine kinase QseC
VATDNQVKGSIEKALKGFDRLIQLVEQLLVLSRLDFETTLSDQFYTDVAKLCREQVDENQQLIEEKHIQMDVTGIYDVAVLCQASSLSILVRNLLDNAIRYSREGGVIYIQVDEKALIVTDEGPGIPEASIESVFDRFYRVPGTRQTGSGLGLSICKRIASLNGFDLSLCNRTDGVQGLKVTLRFK